MPRSPPRSERMGASAKTSRLLVDAEAVGSARMIAEDMESTGADSSGPLKDGVDPTLLLDGDPFMSCSCRPGTVSRSEGCGAGPGGGGAYFMAL